MNDNDFCKFLYSIFKGILMIINFDHLSNSPIYSNF